MTLGGGLARLCKQRTHVTDSTREWVLQSHISRYISSKTEHHESPVELWIKVHNQENCVSCLSTALQISTSLYNSFFPALPAPWIVEISPLPDEDSHCQWHGPGIPYLE